MIPALAALSISEEFAVKDGVWPTSKVQISDVAKPEYWPVPKAITASAEAMIIAKMTNAQPKLRPNITGTSRP